MNMHIFYIENSLWSKNFTTLMWEVFEETEANFLRKRTGQRNVNRISFIN